MKKTRFAAFAITALVVAASVLGIPTSSAHAAAAASAEASSPLSRVVTVPTTLSPRTTSVLAGKRVILRAKTSMRTRTVLLQRLNENGWTTVARRVSRYGKASFPVTARAGVHQYRAISKRRVVNRRLVLRMTVSPKVAVKGVRPAPVDPEPPIEPEEPPTVVTNPDAAAQAAFLTRMYLNQHRGTHSATSYVNNACLAAFAAQHSLHMASQNTFLHSSNSYFTNQGFAGHGDSCPEDAPPYHAEVIALVYAADADAAARLAVDAWIASEVHHAIIDDNTGVDYQVGIGVAQTSDGYWWITADVAFDEAA